MTTLTHFKSSPIFPYSMNRPSLRSSICLLFLWWSRKHLFPSPHLLKRLTVSDSCSFHLPPPSVVFPPPYTSLSTAESHWQQLKPSRVPSPTQPRRRPLRRRRRRGNRSFITDHLCQQVKGAGYQSQHVEIFFSFPLFRPSALFSSSSYYPFVAPLQSFTVDHPNRAPNRAPITNTSSQTSRDPSTSFVVELAAIKMELDQLNNNLRSIRYALYKTWRRNKLDPQRNNVGERFAKVLPLPTTVRGTSHDTVVEDSFNATSGSLVHFPPPLPFLTWSSWNSQRPPLGPFAVIPFSTIHAPSTCPKNPHIRDGGWRLMMCVTSALTFCLGFFYVDIGEALGYYHKLQRCEHCSGFSEAATYRHS